MEQKTGFIQSSLRRGAWNFSRRSFPGKQGLVGFQVQSLNILLCRVGLGPAVRAVRVSSGWNPAVGGPQGEGLVTRVSRGAYISLFFYL